MGGTEGGNNSSTAEEEILIMTALSRVFGVGRPNGGSGGNSTSSRQLSSSVVRASADTVLSICEHAREKRPDDGSTGDYCASVEREIISSIGSKLLSGLAKTTSYLLNSINDNFQEGGEEEEEN
eukprot:4416441-Ditylum_brightwellii.AAC.1